MTRNLLDDESSKLWSEALLDVIVGQAYDTAWNDLLSDVPRASVTVAEYITSITTPGFIQLTNLANRFYRVRTLVRNSITYFPTTLDDVVLDNTTVATATVVAQSAPDFSFFIAPSSLGGSIWMFPLDTVAPVSLTYAAKGKAWSALLDTDAVPWFDGYETVLTFSAAGMASLRGSPTQMQVLQAVADKSMKALVEQLRMNESEIITPRTFDSPEQWGGNA